VAACTTGVVAVIRGVQFIGDGRADVVVAGSSDASLHPLWFAAFDRMGVLSRVDAHGAPWACRPFDRNRSGFALAEGAAALILESARSVRRRGARPLARICGYAMGADPAGLVQVDSSGAALAEVAAIACRRAGVEPGRLAAVQAHGTGTQANDLVEARAIRRLCGPAAAKIPVVSIKGAIGHLLGAAGAVELAVSVLAVARSVLPANTTLLEADPDLGRLCLPRTPVELRAGPVLKTCMGFGGHLAAVVLNAT